MRIEQGQIYEVLTETFMTSGKSNKFDRPINLLRGEMIEIRYPFEWHFRTEDNEYFHCEPKMIEDNCRLHGVIWSNVKSGNECNLKQILDCHLYAAEKNYNRIKSKCFSCKKEVLISKEVYRTDKQPMFASCGCE